MNRVLFIALSFAPLLLGAQSLQYVSSVRTHYESREGKWRLTNVYDKTEYAVLAKDLCLSETLTNYIEDDSCYDPRSGQNLFTYYYSNNLLKILYTDSSGKFKMIILWAQKS